MNSTEISIYLQPIWWLERFFRRSFLSIRQQKKKLLKWSAAQQRWQTACSKCSLPPEGTCSTNRGYPWEQSRKMWETCYYSVMRFERRNEMCEQTGKLERVKEMTRGLNQGSSLFITSPSRPLNTHTYGKVKLWIFTSSLSWLLVSTELLAHRHLLVNSRRCPALLIP